MNEHNHISIFHRNFHSNGGPFMLGSRFNSNGGTINIGHVRLHSTHVRIARRVLEILKFILCFMILIITDSASEGTKRDLGVPKIPGKLSYDNGVVSNAVQPRYAEANLTDSSGCLVVDCPIDRYIFRLLDKTNAVGIWQYNKRALD